MDTEELLRAQQEEATESVVYRKLAQRLSGEARAVLERIAEDEERHYRLLKEHTGKDVPPKKWKVSLYLSLSRIFGPLFVLQLMEVFEGRAKKAYKALGMEDIAKDEERHERELLKVLQKESYLWAVILGLNDAIVELSASLVGLALSLNNNLLTAFAGSVVGFSASLSMALSSFFSARESGAHPYKAALYTGVAYILTTFFLILPFLLTPHPTTAIVMLVGVIFIVLAFYAFYKTITQGTSFVKEWLLHALLALLVAALSFGVGQLLKAYFGIEVG